MKITVDSFGGNCPVNWEEIADYLNKRIEAGEDPEEVWERYCSGRYEDAPEAVMEEEESSMIKDVQSSAAALYDGGWRSGGRDELIAEYDLTEDEADQLCEELERLEKHA